MNVKSHMKLNPTCLHVICLGTTEDLGFCIWFPYFNFTQLSRQSHIIACEISLVFPYLAKAYHRLRPMFLHIECNLRFNYYTPYKVKLLLFNPKKKTLMESDN